MGLNYYKIKKHVRKARKLVIKGTTAAASLPLRINKNLLL